MTTWQHDLQLLRNARFSLLLAGRTIAVIGGAFAPVALAFGVLHLPEGDARTLSIVLAAESIPLVVLLLIGGVIADRLPRNRVILAGQLGSAFAFGLLGLMIFVGWTPLWALCAAAALSGASMAILYPALTGIIPEVVPEDRLQAGNALLSMGVNTGRILGVVASGFVVASLGGAWGLVIAALFFVAGAGFISRLTTSSSGTTGSLAAHSVFSDLKDGWTEFTSHEWLWVIVAQWSLLVMLFNAVHGVLGPVLADAEMGGPRAWSWILAGEGVGMVIGVFISFRLRPKHPILLPVLLLLPTLPLPWLLMGLGTPVWTIVVAAVFMGLAFEVFGIMWNTTMQREVPRDALSRVSSYDALGSLMFGPIGLLLAGPVSEWIGPHAAMIACSVLLFLVGLAPLFSRDVRTLTWRDVPVSGDEDDIPGIPMPAEQMP